MQQPALDGPVEWEAIVTTFIRDHVRRARADGVVLGLSGGLDSALAAALCVRALGTDRVVGLLMPSDGSEPEDAAHGRLTAEHLGIEALERSIAPVLEGAEAALGGPLEGAARANAKARCRMLLLYAEAQRRGALVCGTGNKSELLTGYFTKFGDGGNDLQPLGDLYKTQVRELAEHVGLPEVLITKPPSAGLWPGQTDEEELGMSYDDLDRILKGFEFNAQPSTIAARTGIPLEEVLRIDGLVRGSEHKRKAALVPKLGARTVGVDWRRSVHWDA
ncbi:MAG: NAD+ synthase [Thermoplasmatota archaeon]